MFRIYFDENEGDGHGRFDLGIPGSLQDIKSMAGQPEDGLRVILHEDGTFELDSILEPEPKYNRWMARPLWDTLVWFENEVAPPVAAT